MKITKSWKRYPFRTKVIRKIAEVKAEDLSRIFPSVAENYYFFKTLDESNFEHFSFFYILVYDQHRHLVACAPLFLVNYCLDTSINGPWRQLTNKIKKHFPRFLSFKALVLGIPMGQGQMGLSGNPQLIQVIQQRMEALARKLRATFLAFKDFDSSYDEIFRPLRKKGYIKIDSLPMTHLTLDFKNFEEYLKHLSASTRYDFRRKLKKASTTNIAFSQVNGLDEKTLHEAYALYLQTVQAHDMGFEIVPKEFFRLIALNMPQETKFFLWRINDQLACFLFCLVSHGVLLDYYLGFDYALAHEYHLYFVKFKDVFNWCLAHDIKTYEMGATGYEPKRRLNFKFIPVFLYVKIRYKIFRPVLHLLCALLKFENFDPELQRWKKSLK